MSSAQTFRQIVGEIRRRFVYVSDQEAYGERDVWRALRWVKGNRLAGDCEDYCITVAERCVAAGIPRDQLILHLVRVGNVGNHIVIEHDGIIADCNVTDLYPRDSEQDIYFKWLKSRKLTEQWHDV